MWLFFFTVTWTKICLSVLKLSCSKLLTCKLCLFDQSRFLSKQIMLTRHFNKTHTHPWIHRMLSVLSSLVLSCLVCCEYFLKLKLLASCSCTKLGTRRVKFLWDKQLSTTGILLLHHHHLHHPPLLPLAGGHVNPWVCTNAQLCYWALSPLLFVQFSNVSLIYL